MYWMTSEPRNLLRFYALSKSYQPFWQYYRQQVDSCFSIFWMHPNSVYASIDSCITDCFEEGSQIHLLLQSVGKPLCDCFSWRDFQLALHLYSALSCRRCPDRIICLCAQLEWWTGWHYLTQISPFRRALWTQYPPSLLVIPTQKAPLRSPLSLSLLFRTLEFGGHLLSSSKYSDRLARCGSLTGRLLCLLSQVDWLYVVKSPRRAGTHNFLSQFI